MKKIFFLSLLSFLVVSPAFAQREYNPSFFTILPSFEDNATQWNGFRPGLGHGNPIPADWNWSMNIPQGKSLKSITIKNPHFNEAWSTEIYDIYGKQPYPLVIFNNNKQSNLTYSSYLGDLQGNIKIYGQIENPFLQDAEVVIEYMDGTSDKTYSEDFAYYNEPVIAKKWIAVDLPNGDGDFTGKETVIKFRKSSDQPIDIELWETDKVPNTGKIIFKNKVIIASNYSGTSTYKWILPKGDDEKAFRIYVKYHNLPDVVGDISDNSFKIVSTGLVSEVKRTTTQIRRMLD